VRRDDQRRFFEQRAARYDNRFLRSRWPRNQQLKARVIANFLGDVIEKGPVVEIGCGTGQVAAELLRMNSRLDYVGLDLSPEMLRIARERLTSFGERIELRHVGGTTLPLDDARYAAAFGVDVLHHVDEPEQLLRELRRALRPRAGVIFLEGNPRFPLTMLIALMQKEERGLLKMGFRNLTAWLQSAGFDGISVEYGPLYTPPGPPRLVPMLDAVDRSLGRTPLLRGLAIFFVARARAPAAAVQI
jgi:SAM-dependent methyltransferase